jgi:hypothetical protein
LSKHERRLPQLPEHFRKSRFEQIPNRRAEHRLKLLKTPFPG